MGAVPPRQAPAGATQRQWGEQVAGNVCCTLVLGTGGDTDIKRSKAQPDGQDRHQHGQEAGAQPAQVSQLRSTSSGQPAQDSTRRVTREGLVRP